MNGLRVMKLCLMAALSCVQYHNQFDLLHPLLRGDITTALRVL
jgi:hypothetical protein